MEAFSRARLARVSQGPWRALWIAMVCLFCCAVVSAQDHRQTSPQSNAANFWQEMIDPDRPVYEAVLERAASAQLQEDTFELDVAVTEARLIKPKADGTLYYEAVLARRRGDTKTALQILQELAGRTDLRDISLENIHTQQAFNYTDQQQYKEALAVYQKALAESHGGTSRHVYLGNSAELQMAQGDLKQAISLYQQSLSYSPRYLHALIGLGVALERNGDYEASQGYFLEASIQDPGFSHFLQHSFFAPPEDRAYFEGALARHLGRLKEARGHYERFMKEAPDSPYHHRAKTAVQHIKIKGKVLLGQGSLPIFRPKAVAADPKGRYLTMGDTWGRLFFVRLSDQRLIKAPSLSGTAITALSFDSAQDQLLVGHDDGYITPYALKKAPKRLPVRGPVALPNGTQIRAFSSDGKAVLASTGRHYNWAVAAVDDLTRELGTAQL